MNQHSSEQDRRIRIPLTQPTLPNIETYSENIQQLWASGLLTNAEFVSEFEKKAKEYLGSVECVALSNCTIGLMLVQQALGLQGKVILPSFTFFATAHAAMWNNLQPVFADIDPRTWNLSPDCVETLLQREDGITGIIGVHVFGNPCAVQELEDLAKTYDVKLVFDAAHAFGTKVDGKKIGCFGDAEVFSLSPTKPLIAGEGGLAAVGDRQLAETLKDARDYGNSGNYNPVFAGLNGRMSEFHAALALGSLQMLDMNIERRNNLVDRYRRNLASVSGLRFQEIPAGAISTYKDLTVLVDDLDFNMGRDSLAEYLGKRGIATRKYFYPPVHKTDAYWESYGKQYDETLTVTNEVAGKVLSLPLWSHMDPDTVDHVCETVIEAHEYAKNAGSV